MDCRLVKRWINLYLDGEIDERNLQTIIQHIEECEECSDYFNQAREIKSFVGEIFEEKELPKNFRASVMNEIGKKQNVRDKLKMKLIKKKILVSTIILCMITVLIPVNGKSIAMAAGEWVKSLNFKSKGIEYEIKTNAKMTPVYPNSTVIHDMPYLKKETYEEVLSDTNIYYLEDIDKKSNDGLIIPQYIPEGYKFGLMNQKIYNNQISYKLVYLDKTAKDGQYYYNDSIYITIDKLKHDREFNGNIDYREGTYVKREKKSNYDAVMSKRRLPEAFTKYKNLIVILPEKKYRFSIDAFTYQNEIEEEELIRIIESIIKQID